MKNHVQLSLLLLFLSLLSLSSLFAQASTSGKGFVNARELAESMGLNYRWFPMQKALILSKGGKTMRMEVDQKESQVDNTVVTLPAPPRLEDGEVMIPARSVVQVFGAGNATSEVPPAPQPAPVAPPPAVEEEEEEDPETPAPPQVVIVPPPTQPPPPRIVEEPEEEESDGGTKLISVRHSLREDHTRVVMEFDGNVTHRVERVAPGKFKVRIDGCLNVIPTKRSNPVGRDIKAISFNSGANRTGLVVTIDVPEDGEVPLVETVGNPFRMVVSVKGSAAAPASATPPLISVATAPVPVAVKVASAPIKVVPPVEKTASAPKKIAEKPPVVAEIPVLNATAPAKIEVEESYNVALASLSRPIFAGRTIVIDPGHGGKESGASVADLPPEKQITLGIALKLRQTLKKAGLNALVLRTQDADLSQADRQALANRSGGDLFISLHVGGSADDSVEGCACFAYDPGGVSFDYEASGKLSPQMVFQEWTQSYRFDLSKFLAGKVRTRLVDHLKLKDRGVRSLPLLPLRFLTMPGVLVEIGVLTHPVEGRKIAGANFQEGAAKALTNGILDFFNSIRLNN